jgi:hypothetical protein
MEELVLYASTSNSPTDMVKRFATVSVVVCELSASRYERLSCVRTDTTLDLSQMGQRSLARREREDW